MWFELLFCILATGLSQGLDCNSTLMVLNKMSKELEVFFNVEQRATVWDSGDICFETATSADLLSAGSIVSAVEELKALKAANSLEFIVILNGGKASSLLSTLDLELTIFKSNTVTLVPMQTDWSYLRLRLDSLLFSFEFVGDSVILYEIYSIKSGPPIVRELGTWNPNTGLYIPEPKMWQRRSDLMGVDIRNGLKTWTVFNQLGFDAGGKVVSNKGMFADLMDKLSKRLNFTQVMLEPSDGKWGGLEPDGKTWNGLIKMLIDDKIDISTSGLTQFLERAGVVDFSIPLAQEGTTLISPRSKGVATQFWVYMDIFPVHIWIICAIMVTLLGIAFYSIRIFGSNDYHAPEDNETFTLLNAVAMSSLLVLQLNYEVLLHSVSARIIFLFATFMSYLIYTYYTCDLTARMTSGPPPLSIKSFDDVINLGYRVFTIDGAAAMEMLKNADKGSAMHTVYYDTIVGNPNGLVRSDVEGFARLLKEEKTLYYTSVLSPIGRGDLVALDMTDMIPSQICWNFQKDSEFTEIFNYYLYQNFETGIWARTLHEWTYVASEVYGTPDAPSLGYDNTSFPFLVLAWLMLAACFLAIYEKLFLKMKSEDRPSERRRRTYRRVQLTPGGKKA